MPYVRHPASHRSRSRNGSEARFPHEIRANGRQADRASRYRCPLARFIAAIRLSLGPLEQPGKQFPPNYLHETGRDWLYWDIELEA